MIDWCRRVWCLYSVATYTMHMIINYKHASSNPVARYVYLLIYINGYTVNRYVNSWLFHNFWLVYWCMYISCHTHMTLVYLVLYKSCNDVAICNFVYSVINFISTGDAQSTYGYHKSKFTCMQRVSYSSSGTRIIYVCLYYKQH